MRKYLLLLAMSIPVSIFAEEKPITDEEIRWCVDRSMSARHGAVAEGWIEHILYRLNNDTNKFVTALSNVLEERTDLHCRRCLVNDLRKYGNKSALPIFYKHLSDPNCLYYAAWGVLAHEGLTSNSVMKISEGLQRFKDTRPAFDAFGSMMHYASKEKDEDIRRLAVNEGIVYATKNRDRTEIVDKLLMEADESYRLSKRRLNVLRSVKAIGLTKWNKEFVEKVIKELEAYPEEKLPE